MARLVDLIGTPVCVNCTITSDGGATSNFAGIPVQGLEGILFLALNSVAITTAETASFQITYSTSLLASDAAASNSALTHSCTDAVIQYSSDLGEAIASIRSLWLDLSAKGWTEGSIHCTLTGEACAAGMSIIGIPWPATRTLPIYTPTYTADD
jgi:hypothetical protein